MEFTIQKADLVHELQTVTGVVEKRTTLPILANLLLQAEGKQLKVGASDLEVTVRGTAPAQVSREGSVTLPAGKLHQIARSLPDAEIQFKLVKGNSVAITCERVRFRIAGQTTEEFPKFPDVEPKNGVELPAGILRRMIERVTFAITSEDPRYSLNGALMRIRKGNLVLVATDGHRLAYIARDVAVEPPGGEEEMQLIVPRKALSELAKLAAELEEGDKITFGRTDQQVFFIVGGHTLTSTLLEGTFPRYENVMPASCDIVVKVPSEHLAAAVRRVSLLINERLGRGIRLKLGDGKLELSAETEMGEAQETLAVDYDGEEITIGFNARYLLDFLAVVGSPSIAMELNAVGKKRKDEETSLKPSERPGQLRPEPSGEFDYRYIVMPLQL